MVRKQADDGQQITTYLKTVYTMRAVFIILIQIIASHASTFMYTTAAYEL